MSKRQPFALLRAYIEALLRTPTSPGVLPEVIGDALVEEALAYIERSRQAWREEWDKSCWPRPGWHQVGAPWAHVRALMLEARNAPEWQRAAERGRRLR